jgi:hypothetical protein
MIKQFVLSFLSALLFFSAPGQERKDLTLSVAGGKLFSPYYQNNTSGRFFGFDFDYTLAKRHVLSVNYTDGEHRYYDKVHASGSATTINADRTNAEATYHTFSVLYKYKFLSTPTVSGDIGAGAGLMAHSQRYPFSTGISVYYQQSVWTDLVFPVRLEVEYRLSKRVNAGVIGGFFIQPDFPVLAYHVGPRISYCIH